MSRTDLRALVSAMQTGNPEKIHAVLRHPLDDHAPASSVDTTYSARLLAVHFLRRFADALEHHWRLEPDELALLLEVLEDVQPDLRPTPLTGRD